jgi:hypothetical protein
MQAYAFKGQALEDLSKLFLQVPLPKKAGAEEKKQLQQASEETKQKAVANYKEGLLAAQNYHVDNEARQKIVSRLRELAADAPELNATPTERPKSSAPAAAGTPVAASAKPDTSAAVAADFKDIKYDANMKRIEKIYENSSLSEDQKIELLLQMETEAKREITEMNQDMGSQGADAQSSDSQEGK